MSAASPAPWDHFVIRRLIFRWPERNASFTLPLLFLASVAVHALTFYLFQVVYPPTGSITPQPAQVTFLADTPENAALLRWTEAQDPATAARIQEVTPPGLGVVAYVPSYAREHPLPQANECLETTTVFPPARDLPAPMAAPSPAGPARSAAVRTALFFSEALQSREAGAGTAIQPPVKSSAALHPSEFLLAVDDRGEVRYCFLEASCGEREIDREAEELLRQHAFQRTEKPAPLLWGFATFIWGLEAYSPPAVPEKPGS